MKTKLLLRNLSNITRFKFKNNLYFTFTKNYHCDLESKDAQLIKHQMIGNNILELTIDSPHNKNALSKKLMDEFEDHIKLIKEEVSKNRASIKAVLLKSSDKKIFCAGADLKERNKMSEDDVKAFVTRLRNSFHAFSLLEVPTIACINGYALGGGLELALACDLRLITKTSVLGLSETSLGVIPGAGGTQRLPRLVGVAKAKEMIFTAARLNADECLKVGLVNDVVDDIEALNSKALDMANKIAGNAPLSIYASKLAIDEGISCDLQKSLLVEGDKYNIVLKSEDRIEGLKAFLEKRRAEFKGE